MSDLDQETAQVLFHQGAILVFLDLPEGAEFGMDYNSWTVGPKFRGVKMIPPGLHFVYYSAVSQGQTAPRSGFFHFFKKKEVLVKKWDRQKEDLSSWEPTAEDMERFTSNKKEMDRYLGVYPYDSYKKWVSLTNQISESLLGRLQPESGMISAVTQFQSERSNTKERREANEKTQKESSGSMSASEAQLPDLECIPGTSIRFTPVPRFNHPKNATPAEITKYSMDRTYTLNTMLSAYSESVEILGELQFAFTTFLIGQVYDAFEQWKKLVHLLCNSEEAMALHKELYNQFISTMHFQVREIPEDFFIDIVTENNFLTSTLRVFFASLVDNTDVDSKLRQRGLKFRDNLTQKFRWDFTVDPDEDAPVVVEGV